MIGRRRFSIYASEALASVYQQQRPVYNDKWVDAVLHGLGDTRQLKAVDVGAGSLQAALALSRRVDGVIAVDQNFSMLESQQQALPANVEVRTGVAESLPMEPSETCDLVIAAQCFHWFEKPLFYAELDRVLKPGGRFVATVYGPAMHFDDERASVVTRALWERTKGAQAWSDEFSSHCKSRTKGPTCSLCISLGSNDIFCIFCCYHCLLRTLRHPSRRSTEIRRAARLFARARALAEPAQRDRLHIDVGPP